MSATAQTNGRSPRVPRVAAVPPPVPELDPTPAVRGATPHLDAAVLRVQGKASKLMRNADGQIQNRQYKYVTLSAVIDELLPLLDEEQLVFKAWPTIVEGGKPGLRYRISHIPSLEFDEDTMPLPCEATMQGLGSGITYARRYAQVTYFNLSVEEDDDGASANPTAATSQTTDPKPTAERKAAPRRANAKQRGMLQAKAKAAKLTEDEFANLILVATGNEVRTYSSEEHAKQTVDRLLDHLAAGAVGKVKDALVEREQAA